MPIETWSAISLIALVDAINFPVVLILIFVLGRPNALANGLAYSAGMLGTHLLGGILFAAGLSRISDNWLDSLGGSVGLIETAVGILAVFMSFTMSARPTEDQRVSAPRRAGLASWFTIGFGITMTKLPIAVLYGTAMHQVATRADNIAWAAAGLAWYNIVAFLPFYGIWIVWAVWRSQSKRILNSVNDAIREHAPAVMKYGLMLVGLALTADGLARYNGAPFLF